MPKTFLCGYYTYIEILCNHQIEDIQRKYEYRIDSKYTDMDYP